MVDVRIDPGVRVGVNNQLTFTGLTDVDDDDVPEVGTAVRAVSRDGTVTAPAIVIAVNEPAMLIYLAVAWQELTNSSDLPAWP